eukprot:scaffold81991_cov72-Phaeocystis_antarctica.AAC.10
MRRCVLSLQSSHAALWMGRCHGQVARRCPMLNRPQGERAARRPAHRAQSSAGRHPARRIRLPAGRYASRTASVVAAARPPMQAAAPTHQRAGLLAAGRAARATRARWRTARLVAPGGRAGSAPRRVPPHSERQQDNAAAPRRQPHVAGDAARRAVD